VQILCKALWISSLEYYKSLIFQLLIIPVDMPNCNKGRIKQANNKSMKLEEQVCSLDLAKRLKELGVKQESHWYWITSEVNDRWILVDNSFHGSCDGYEYCQCESVEDLANDVEQDEEFHAYSVAELGEILTQIAYASSYARKYSEWKDGRKTYNDITKSLSLKLTLSPADNRAGEVKH
jgi:hypothetical protein